MAYISASTAETPDAASANFTPTLLPHVAGDLIVLYVFQDGGGTDITTATAGWNKHGTFAASGGSRGGFFSKIAASGSETAPAFAGTNDEWGCVQLIVKDADTANPIDVVSSRVDVTTAQTWNSPTPTTNTDNVLLLYGANNDATPWQSPEARKLLFANGITATAAAAVQATGWVGHRNQYTAGVVSAIVTTKHLSSSAGGNNWAIGIKNKSGGLMGPHPADAPAPLEKALGATLVLGSFVAPNTIAASINSINCEAAAPTASTTTIVAPELRDYFLTNVRLTASSDTNPYWQGPLISLTSTADIDGDSVGLTWSTSGIAANQLGASGAIAIFADAALNYEAFHIVAPAKAGSATAYAFFVNPSAATATYSSGTVDYAAIKYVGMLYHRIAAARTYDIRAVIAYLGKTPFTIAGGSASSPATPRTVETLMTGWGQGPLRAPSQGAGQVVVTSGFQIGDGSTQTYFKMLGNSVEFPVPSTATSSRKEWLIGPNTFAIQVKASASDTMDFRGGLFNTASAQDFTIHADSSTSAAYYWNGLVIAGPWDVTWKTGVTATAITFAGCDEINFKGADVSSCYIQNTASTDAAIAFDTTGATVTGTTIDVTGTAAAYHIELGTACESITLADVTFAGTPGTDKVHVKKTTGTVTINISGTTTLADGDVTSDGADVDVLATPVYQTVTISGATAGSRIQIYDTTSSAELYNGLPSFPYTWTDAAIAAADRAIRLRVSYVSGVTAKHFIEANIGTCGQTAGTAAVSYLVNQTDDEVYINNGINGSAVTGVTFTDAAADVINVDVAANTVSWKSIYAAWVYYAFGAAGIATDIDYIDAVDEANYRLSSMVVKNTSDPTAPLEITGGYGRDATTGAAIDLVDTTGGTIVMAPDHVVSYAVGSALTAAQDAKLSAIDGSVSSYLDATITSRASQTSVSNIAIAGTATTYVPSTATRTTGDDDGGSVVSLAAQDDISMVTGEVTVAPGIDVLVVRSASTVTEIPSLARIRGFYRGITNHHVEILAWNYATSVWEEKGLMQNRTTAFEYVVPLSADQHNPLTGEMQLRFLHDAVALQASHYLSLDYVAWEKIASSSSLGSDVAAIRAKTDNLPEFPASEETLEAAADLVDELHKIKGLDASAPLTVTGYGTTTPTLTAGGITLALSPTGGVRT
jgi:hypothetical protein